MMTPKGGPVNAHKETAMNGAGSGAPSMASTQGQRYDHPPTAPLMDSKRAHPGRGGKATPSRPTDVDHGHKWGK